jgi:hypothetical protein
LNAVADPIRKTKEEIFQNSVDVILNYREVVEIAKLFDQRINIAEEWLTQASDQRYHHP